jgi:hypothetical protein
VDNDSSFYFAVGVSGGKIDLESEKPSRIYVKDQASLGAQDRVREPSKLNIDLKIGNMCSYSREARWCVSNTGAMLAKRI